MIDPVRGIYPFVAGSSRCVSGTIPEVAGKKALLQAGGAVPIFSVTKNAQELIIDEIRQSDNQVLFKTTPLAARAGQQPEPLV